MGKINKTFFSVCIFFSASVLLAESIETEKTLVSESDLRSRRFELHPQVSILDFNNLSLHKNGESFSYQNSMQGLPMVGVNLSTPLGASGDFDFYGLLGFSYGTKKTEILLSDKVTAQSVRLHAIPLSLEVKARYHMPQIPSIKPAFLFGVGSSFFHQSVADSSFTGSFLMPTAIIGLSLGLFDPGLEANDWFGGFNFGMKYQHGLTTEHQLRAVSFELGMVVVL